MSALHEALCEYVATIRALGTKLHGPALGLRRFVDFLEEQGAERITSELALRWATAPVGVQPATRAARLGMVRGFAVWLHAIDPKTEIPARGLLTARHRRKSPYIFSDREIRALMAAAAGLVSPTGLRALSYETLIGLLAVSGLRPGEALALDDPDIDLPNAFLIVRQAKFGKARFVPFGEATRTALAHYRSRRDALCARRTTAAFLVSEQGARLGHAAARRTFAKLSQAIGLRPLTQRPTFGRGPRLQDLRHTFATRRLIEWYRTGQDVNQRLPGLATYLGHSHVHCTYWYIQAVPELLDLATERLAHRDDGERP
jgi:integrase